MKKKLTAVALIVCMFAIMLVGATMAYFTDDEQVTNTMTVGNIDISIVERTYEDGTWGTFENDKFMLYPVKNDVGFQNWNKMVYTNNDSTSGSEAYIRNIVLIEANDLLEDNYANEGGCCVAGIHYKYTNAPSTSGEITYHASKATQLDNTVEIDGEKYWVVVFEEAEGKAIAKGSSLSSLTAVWMDKGIESDDIAGWGEKVDIIVFSQGIQAEGLTYAEAMEALGDVETNLTEWLKADAE